MKNQSNNRSAASIVFSISIAIVIGPTPPGTGVIADALPIRVVSSPSPTILYPFGE